MAWCSLFHLKIWFSKFDKSCMRIRRAWITRIWNRDRDEFRLNNWQMILVRYTKGIDMWSLGCILGEMQLGKPLFPGSSTINQVERIMATLPPPTEEGIAFIVGWISSNSLLGSFPTWKKIVLKDLSLW